MRYVLPVLFLAGCAGVATVGHVRPGDDAPSDTFDTAADTWRGDTFGPDTSAAVVESDAAVDTDAETDGPPAPQDTAPTVGDTGSTADSPARPPGPPPDVDADGYCAGGVDCPVGLTVGDCDDTDADVNPGAVDVAGDGVDQDCDGVGGPLDTWTAVDTADTGSAP